MKFDPITRNNVHVWGKPSASQTIIFAHGFGTDQTSWTSVAEAFSREYRIIVYDNVGGGKSDPAAFSPNKYDRLESYADDLLDICEALKVTDAIMVGHSVSGMISLLAAVKNPTRFSKMVMVGASPRYCNDIGYTGGFDQESLNQLYDAMNNNYFAWVSGFAPMAMANPDKPHLAESFATTLNAIRPDIAQSVARVIFQSDHRSDLKKLDKPTLIVQSNEDIAVPMEVASYLNTHIRGSELRVVNAKGHFPHISAPTEVIKAIKSFI